MASRRLSHSIYFVLIVCLLPYQTMAQGKLALYTNFYCTHASTLLPTVEVPLSTCLVPIGAISVYIDVYPGCDNGSAAQMIMYTDTSCSREAYGNVAASGYAGTQDNPSQPCYYLYVSESVPSVMFTCDDPATYPQATSTSIVTASLLAAVASAPTAGSKTTASMPTTTQHESGSTTTTGSTSSNTGSSSTNTNSANSPSSTSSSSSLSLSDKIAIGVGLGVGIPTILISLAAYCWPRR